MPIELLQAILTRLDYRSIARFTETCLQAIIVVKSMPEYRDLMRHVPSTLVALRRLRLLHAHSVASLHDVLTSQACASCGEFGPFLFLPTCKRACNECLIKEPDLWIMPHSARKQCFNGALLKLPLPTVRIFCAQYLRDPPAVMRSRPPKEIVCIKTAREWFAINYGHDEHAIKKANAKIAKAVERDRPLIRWLHSIPAEDGNAALSVGSIGCPTQMVCINFPYVKKDQPVENGIWCGGCELTYKTWRRGRPWIGHIVSPEEAELITMQHRARTTASFEQHIKSCPGAIRLGIKCRSDWRMEEGR